MTMHITPHFKWSEFASRGEPVPPEYRANVRALCFELEILRAWVGGKPITVISGWRSYEHNEALYAKERMQGDMVTGRKSRHRKGKAADIRIQGMQPPEARKAILDLIALGKLRDGGVGIYPTFVHYDTGKKGRRW